MTRIYAFLLPIACVSLFMTFTGCSPDDDDVATPSGGGTPAPGIPAGDHVRFTLNGQESTYSVDGRYDIGALGTSQEEGTVHQEAQGSVLLDQQVEPPMMLYWTVLKEFHAPDWGFTPTPEEQYAMITQGAKVFGRGVEVVGLDDRRDGVVVSYIAPDGTMWTTDQGTGDQTGSSFTIVSKEAVSHWMYQARVLVTFSCKLYNGTGDVMTLTNASMRGPCITRL